MQNAECRAQSAEQNGKGASCTLRKCRPFFTPHSALCTPHSALCTHAFTLIEMLVVIAIIGMLAGMLTAVIVHASSIARRVACQQNLEHIGQAVSLQVLSNNGLYPIGPMTFDSSNNVTSTGLSNAYPRPQPSDNPALPPNDSGFPWWARVFEQMEGDMGLLFVKNGAGVYETGVGADPNFNPNGHVLTAQLPQAMNVFHCPMAGALDRSSVANLFNSISYGINFDVKDSGTPSGTLPGTPLGSPLGTPPMPPLPYCFNPASDAQYPSYPGHLFSPRFPGALLPADKYPDQYRATEIQNPSQFILISEACTQSPQSLSQPFPQSPLWSNATAYVVGDIVSSNNVVYTCIAPNSNCQPSAHLEDWKPGYWTGGRISMTDTTSNGTGYERTSADSPPHNAPIVGRHGGYTNVLFADWHVEAIEIVAGQTAAN